MSNKQWGKRKRDGQSYIKGDGPAPISGGRYDITPPPTMNYNRQTVEEIVHNWELGQDDYEDSPEGYQEYLDDQWEGVEGYEDSPKGYKKYIRDCGAEADRNPDEGQINSQVSETLSSIVDWREEVKNTTSYGVPGRADMEDLDNLIQDLPVLNQGDFNAIKRWKREMDKKPYGVPSRTDMEDLDDILDDYR